MIVRILGEGQWDVTDDHLVELNKLDDELEKAVETGDEQVFASAEYEFRNRVDDVEASTLYVMGLSDFTVAPIAIDGWYDELNRRHALA